jgi:hypothetical protein
VALLRLLRIIRDLQNVVVERALKLKPLERLRTTLLLLLLLLLLLYRP